jgi:TolB-like protein
MSKAILFLVTCSLLATAFASPDSIYDYKDSNTASQPSIRYVAVFPFENMSGSPDFDPLGKGISEFTQIGLSKFPAINTVERVKLNYILDELAIQKELDEPLVGVRTGRIIQADLIVLGSFSFFEDSVLQINARLVEVELARMLASVTVSGRMSNAVSVIDELVYKLAEEISSNEVIPPVGSSKTVTLDQFRELSEEIRRLASKYDRLITGTKIDENREEIIDTRRELDSVTNWLGLTFSEIQRDLDVVGIVAGEKDAKLFAAGHIADRILDFDKRLSEHSNFFLWIMGIFVTLVTVVIGWLTTRIHGLDKRTDRINIMLGKSDGATGSKG